MDPNKPVTQLEDVEAQLANDKLKQAENIAKAKERQLIAKASDIAHAGSVVEDGNVQQADIVAPAREIRSKFNSDPNAQIASPSSPLVHAKVRVAVRQRPRQIWLELLVDAHVLCLQLLSVREFVGRALVFLL